MSKFAFFRPTDNVAPNATVTTGGTANSSYPLANLTSLSYKNLPNPSKLTGTTGDWILDFGSTQRIDAVVLWHNFDSGLAYHIQMNATNSWISPTVDLSTTAPTKRADGYTLKAYHDLTGVNGYSAGGFRYLRINVTGTNSAALGLKLWVFSSIRTLTGDFQLGASFDETQTSITMQTDARVPWRYDLGSAPRRLSADLSGTTADLAILREWFRSCAGSVNPTVIVPDPTVNDAWPGFLQFNASSEGVGINTLQGRLDVNNIYRSHIEFEELTAGDPEWV